MASVCSNRNKSAIDYIKELSQNFNIPVKIACVTNIKHAQDLINQLKKMGNRISFLEKHQVLNLNLRDISTHIKLKDNSKRTIFALKVSGLKLKHQVG